MNKNASLQPEVHPIIRVDFLTRVVTFPGFMLVLLAHLYPTGLSPMLLIAALAQAFIWPHVGYLVARHSKTPKATELRNLMLDALMMGAWMPVVQFSIWPSTAIAVGLVGGVLSVGGPMLAVRGVAFLALGVVLSGAVVGFHVQPEASLLVALLSGAELFCYMLTFAYLSYAQLKEYLSVLVENGLLGYEEGELKYKTTEKGLRFMRTYSEIGEMVSPET